MAAPEVDLQPGLIDGPGLPEDTIFVRPINVYGSPIHVAIPVIRGPIDGVVLQFLQQLPFQDVDIAGFEPCTAEGEPIAIDTPDGPLTPRILYGMQLVDDDHGTGDYLVSRKHPWRAPVQHRVRVGVDTMVLTTDFEAAEGSRLRRAA